MSEQDSVQLRPLFHSDDNTPGSWNAHWRQHRQPWRTEQEIDRKRQEELAQYRAIMPDIEKGRYPFKGIKLSRADVEWLLATHENGRGPVDWNDKNQRTREGLDLRGADLCEADLHRLPLACLRASLILMEGSGIAEEKRNAAMLLKGVDLSEACLQKAILNGVNLNGANLAKVRLEKATLIGASIKYVSLEWANLRKADLSGANLEGSDLTGTHLERAFLFKACLKDVCLFGAHLEGAILEKAHLELSDLNNVFLEDTYLYNTFLADKNGIGPRMADMHWGEVNLTILDWEQIKKLGDEYRAEQKLSDGDPKSKSTRRDEYKEAVRAYRQLATVLRNQGLNEDATPFAYRAQLMQRKVFWYRMLQDKGRLVQWPHSFWAWLFSWVLFLVSGYGYKPARSFATYLIVISIFAIAYYAVGHIFGPVLSPLGSVVFSMTSFHGRGFFPGGISLDDPLTVVAAFEAFIGLLIEVTFIATLTQRLFGK